MGNGPPLNLPPVASLYTSIFRPVSMESSPGSSAAKVFSLGTNSPWVIDEPINHQEVMEIGKKVYATFRELLTRIIPRLEV